MEEDEQVFINKDDLNISLSSSNDQDRQGSRHEFYFYPDNEAVTEGWRSYKVEDKDPFGSAPPGVQTTTQLPPIRTLVPSEATVTHKLIMLGDSGVGKTSLLVYYQTGEFKPGSFSATIGVALTNKSILVDQSYIHLQIWDTAGQERFKSVTNTYYRDAQALLLLYDVTNSESFINTRQWLTELREYSQEDIIIMLLGNKADCESELRQVRPEEGERMAREYHVDFLETSAKTGLNIDAVFETVARKVKNRKSGQDPKFSFTIQEVPNERAQRSCPNCNTILKL